MADDSYANIREILGDFIGRRLLEITQHDEEYFVRTGRSFIDFMFEDGDVLRFYLCGEKSCLAVNPTEESEREKFGDL